MARYNSQGWHYQSTRHSNARKYGRAGGKYARTREFLKGNPKFTRIDMMFKWEDMNPDYMESQMTGLIMEISKPKQYQDLGYIREKIRNIKSQFNWTFDNFAKRIEEPTLQKEFLKKMEENKKNLSFEFNKQETKM